MKEKIQTMTEYLMHQIAKVLRELQVQLVLQEQRVQKVLQEQLVQLD